MSIAVSFLHMLDQLIGVCHKMILSLSLPQQREQRFRTKVRERGNGPFRQREFGSVFASIVRLGLCLNNSSLQCGERRQLEREAGR